MKNILRPGVLGGVLWGAALLGLCGVVDAGKILEEGKKVYSQGDEELIVRDFFNDRAGGVFCDVGAGDYRHESTTYYLEERLGWSGVAVDALSEFRTGYLAHRPRTRFFSYIVTDHDGGEERFYRLPASPYLSSKSKLRVAATAFHYGVKGSREVVRVPAITLNSLLEACGIPKIDFLSMDIEGGEPDALRGFDIEKYRPELVCVERNRAVLGYFRRHGYELIRAYLKRDPVNWYFRPVKGLYNASGVSYDGSSETS